MTHILTLGIMTNSMSTVSIKNVTSEAFSFMPSVIMPNVAAPNFEGNVHFAELSIGDANRRTLGVFRQNLQYEMSTRFRRQKKAARFTPRRLNPAPRALSPKTLSPH
jgi:hypothetical protein